MALSVLFLLRLVRIVSMRGPAPERGRFGRRVNRRETRGRRKRSVFFNRFVMSSYYSLFISCARSSMFSPKISQHDTVLESRFIRAFCDRRSVSIVVEFFYSSFSMGTSVERYIFGHVSLVLSRGMMALAFVFGDACIRYIGIFERV